jgi:hypothetical protein
MSPPMNSTDAATLVAAGALRSSLEQGVELSAVLQHIGAVTGPTLGECYDAALELVSPSSRPTYMTHWRRLIRGFTIEPELMPTLVEVTDDLGIRFDTAGEYPTIEGYYDDRHRRPTPMTLVVPPMADRGLLSFKLPELSRLARLSQAIAITHGRERSGKRELESRPGGDFRGDEAVRSFAVAWNFLFGAAVRTDKIASTTGNPMQWFKRPPRNPKEKMGLTAEQLKQLWWVASTDDYDPELYAHLVKFHLRVGAREEGAINLNIKDLDYTKWSIWLDEKFNTRLDVPVDREYLDELRTFAASRGNVRPNEPVFSQKRRVPGHDGELTHPRISTRTYNRLHRQVQDQLSWAADYDFGVHWLRGHASAVMLSVAGNEAVKKRFLRHRHRAAIDRYAPATFENVAWTVGRAYGFEHPMAEPYPGTA